MDHTIPELEQLLHDLDLKDTNDRHFLLDEVRFSDLKKMNDANLNGRLAYYEREYTFELNARKRSEFYREVIRTKIAIRARVLEKRRAAITEGLQARKPVMSEGNEDPFAGFARIAA